MKGAQIVFAVGLLGVAGAVVLVSLAGPKQAAPPMTKKQADQITGGDPNVNANLAATKVSIATGYAPVDLKTQVITLEHLQDNDGQFAFSGGYYA